MAKLSRVTGKVFGETATATGNDPEIGQFGSAKSGTYVGTTDVATIQNLSAWSKGWINAVTANTQFPPLPEMTGVHKVLSYQNAYLLQQGIPEWDSGTTYYTNGFCSKAGKIYVSLSNDNTNHNPESDTTNWKEFKASGYRPTIFDMKWSDHLINDIQWLRGDTFSWQSGSVYVTAYNELVSEYNNASSTTETEGSITFKRTPKGYKIADATQETAILTKYDTDGIAWYYILDTTNTRFKLPRTKFGFEGLRTSVGDDIAESLPNITGNLYLGDHSTTQTNIIGVKPNLQSTGCFSNSGSLTHNSYNLSLTSYRVATPRFDASLSSSSYQDNAPVQERATQMYLYFYVGEYTQSAIEQTAGLNTELFNGKVDLNCSNVSSTQTVLTKTDASNLNTQGKSLISGLGMLSNRYVNLTLGASGSSYIAPANGSYVISKQASASNQNLSMYVYDTNSVLKNAIKINSTAANSQWLTLYGVRRGETVYVGYTLGGATNSFRFYYAEGEPNE